ncbi:hypothetical protein ACKKBF_B39305 [Auxenochlorella protothecoides x Auxenochlorella symbiontica]
MPKRKHEPEVEQQVEEEQQEAEAEVEEENGAGQGSESVESGSSSDDMEGPSSAEEESEDDSDGEAFDSVTVDFDFSEPQEDDFLGLKVLLTNYLDGVTYDGSGLVDLVLKHSKLGTVIKCEDDVLGVTTVLPLASVAGTRSLSDLGKFLLARVGPELKDRVQQSLADKAMGLLLSERLINCPPAVAPPLQQALREDLQAHQGKPRMKHLLLLARAFRDSRPAEQPAGKKGGKGSSSSKAELIFTQPEAECCFKHAVWTAEFAARETQEGRNKSCRPVRLILCIPCAALHRIGQDLEALLGSPAE